MATMTVRSSSAEGEMDSRDAQDPHNNIISRPGHEIDGSAFAMAGK